jgi:phage-related protein
MPAIAFYRVVWEELSAAQTGLRAACKTNLDRLAGSRPGVASGLRLEKVQGKITELKVSWNKQEFRLLFFYGPKQHRVRCELFQKKTRKIPQAQIDLAVQRMKEIQLDQTTIINRGFH